MTINNCATCRYISSQSQHRFIEETGRMGNKILPCCRRRAPVFAQSDDATYFPEVHKDDWCGEYEKKDVN